MPSSNFLFDQFDHFVSHNDGNNNDVDDISALVIQALFTKAAGFEQQSTFFYNNNLTEPNNFDEKSGPRSWSQVDAMRQSAAFAEDLGIQTYDYQAGTNEATQSLVEILDSGKEVLSFEGGPMEAMYRALEQVSPENLGNITLMSHSRGFNEQRAVVTRPGVSVARNLADIIEDFPEVNILQIDNQNGADRAGPEGFNSPLWEWMDSTQDPLLQEARSLMGNTRSSRGRNDASDAGMIFYALTGNEGADPLDAEEYLRQNLNSLDTESPSEATPTTPQSILRIEAEDIANVEGYGTETIEGDSGRQVLSLRRQSANRGSVTFGFNEEPGTYDLIVGTYDEVDGESTFELQVNNRTINTLELDRNLDGNSPTAQNFVTPTLGSGVTLTPGDTITINGFRDGNEWARLDFIELSSSIV